MTEAEEFERRNFRKALLCFAIYLFAFAAIFAFVNGASFILDRMP